MAHLIGRANNSIHLFQNPNDFTKFRDILLKYTLEAPIFIHNYVFMHTHFHLLAWIEDTSCLAPIMKAINLSYNYYYQRAHGYRGHIWRNRFRSVLITHEAQWQACGRYIEINPVRASICEQPEMFPWSSYHYYAFGKEDPLLRPIKGMAGGEIWLKGSGSPAYREFVLAGVAMNQDEMRRCYSAR